MDKVLQCEFDKGLLAGIEQFRQMPEMIVEGLEEEVTDMLTQLEVGEDHA